MNADPIQAFLEVLRTQTGLRGVAGYVDGDWIGTATQGFTPEARDEVLRDLEVIRECEPREYEDLATLGDFRTLDSVRSGALRYCCHIRREDKLSGIIAFDEIPRRMGSLANNACRNAADLLPFLLNHDPTRNPETARYMAVFHESALGILVVGLDGSIEKANPAALDVLGKEASAVIGQRLENAIGLSDADQPLDELIHGLFPHYVVEKRIDHPRHGHRQMRTNVNAVRDADGRVAFLVAMLEDITQEHSRKEQLRRARDEAEEASRAKSRFLANMSHELRTPLNSVIGFSKVLRSRTKERLEAKELDWLDRIHSNGLHLLGLLNDILDLSKIESGKMSVEWDQVDLGNVVRTTVAELEGRVLDRDVEIVVAIPSDLAPIRSDATKLRQILTNLIGNAIKFTEKGTIQVNIAVTTAGSLDYLEVSDTGIGIPEERLEAIFQAFEQADGSTSREHGGTGLGLAISRSLAEMLGFRLTVTSTVGKGTSFRLNPR